jgi:hypothetical protein
MACKPIIAFPDILVHWLTTLDWRRQHSVRALLLSDGLGREDVSYQVLVAT